MHGCELRHVCFFVCLLVFIHLCAVLKGQWLGADSAGYNNDNSNATQRQRKTQRKFYQLKLLISTLQFLKISVDSQTSLAAEIYLAEAP
jgi:hypothetical protein